MTKKILIFKSGLLGDTLVALPALNCLRDAFPKAKIVYVWQKIPNKNYVTPVEILAGSGLIDEFYGYEVATSLYKTLLSYIKLWLFCILKRFDIGIVLEVQHWPARRKKFLRMCGIRTVIGPDGAVSKIQRDESGTLPIEENISDSLVALLKPLNIKLSLPGKGKFDIMLSSDEEKRAMQWLTDNGLTPEDTKRLIAVAPGSNMAAKRWSSDNFFSAIDALIAAYTVIPIVFGGHEDRGLAENLITKWKQGLNAAGCLNVREGIALLRLCRLFVGNDTGTMHMAVAAGIPCVAIFASIDMPGRWEPYGDGHYVLRSEIECAGCLLRECDKGPNQCISKITPELVFEKCEKLLSNKIAANNQ